MNMNMNADAMWQQMVHTWANGGYVMPALALLALLLYARIARLLMALYLPGVTRATDSVIQSWVHKPTVAPKRIRTLILFAQDEVETPRALRGRFQELHAACVAEFDRQLAVLKVLVVAAPLFGLLGTVLGMLLTFKAISVGGSSAGEVVAKGISEALVATQTGMMVALPGLMGAFVAKRWRNELVSFLARLENVMLHHFRRNSPSWTTVVQRPLISEIEPTLPQSPATPSPEAA